MIDIGWDTDLKNLSDEDLVRGMAHKVESIGIRVNVEMNRRLKVVITKLNKLIKTLTIETSKYSERLIWLTGVLIIFTLVLVILTLVLVLE